MLTLIVQTFICFSIVSLTPERYLYVIYIVFSFICEAAHFVIFPAVCSTIYGSKLGSSIYGYLYFARALAAMIGIVGSSVMLPKFGWLGCFIFFGILTIVSFILLLVFNEHPLPSDSLKEIGESSGPSINSKYATRAE
jgi:MFS family permease